MLPWIILFLPLVSFSVIALFLRKRHGIAAAISTTSAVLGAALAIYAVFGDTPVRASSIRWLDAGDLHLRIGFSWNLLPQIILLIVTIVGALIHIYSLGYMRKDSGKGRFFAYLSLFMFSMLGIVLSRNFVMMFMFWELVGLSSYLLIGFWYAKPSAAEAGKKAFLVNKLGDVGFILGIILVWSIWKEVDFQALSLLGPANLLSQHQASSFSSVPVWVVGLLLFCGAIGKSAQFPLHVWLPDAMEGPTPVSALIHAATMVAAGVFMLCRIWFILELSPITLGVVAWTGGITALLAALWAVAQNDIKRILAYSTMSQLGYMVMAVGLSSPGSAMFHLTTHAFFKALLFLGAGSVIVALHHEQNIWKMGGLWAKMPSTTITFVIGLAALCGVPFSAGALSKDEILAVAWMENRALWMTGVFTAFLTAFYMGRLFMVAFLGRARGHAAKSAVENGHAMILPLWVLAVFSLSFVWNCSDVFACYQSFGGFPEHKLPFFLHGIFILIPTLGLGAAVWVYRGASEDKLAASVRDFLATRFWLDEIYEWLVEHVQGGVARLFRAIDVWIVDGLGVKGISLMTVCSGGVFRLFQTGNLQTYAVYLGVAIVALIYWTMIR